MQHLYHIADPTQWQQARLSGEYKHPTLLVEGFIHCSTSFQLEQTANRYFADHPEILILCIEVQKVKAPIRYEASPHGEFFPHIYGPLYTDAIVATKQVKRGDNKLYKIAFDQLP